MRKVLPCATSCYKVCIKYFLELVRPTKYHEVCRKYFPVLLCTTKLAERTSPNNFVLQSLHRGQEGARGGERATSTTSYSYYKAWAKHFPAPLVLQNLRKIFLSTNWYCKALPTTGGEMATSTTSYCKPWTKNFPAVLRTTKLAKYFPVLLCTAKLAETIPGPTAYFKAYRQYVPVLIRIAKLARNTSQYYFVLQSLEKPFGVLFTKAYRKYVPVLICFAKLAQSTSQYYSHRGRDRARGQPVLLRIATPAQSTSLQYFYKACGKYFPVLICTTKLLQSTSHHYFVLQTLRKVLPNSTSYYKACRKCLPVCFVPRSLQKVLPSTTL